MGELIGFSQPNDLAAHLLRAKLARRFGVFGHTPIWGGVRLHEFYPPLSTVIIQKLGITGAVLFYFLLTSIVWSIGKGPITATLFLVSYFHLIPMLYMGRYTEFLGYTLVASAVFAKDGLISGILLGLAGLSHPVALLFGLAALALRLDVILFLVAFIICGWWYVPFVLKRRKLSFLKEKRPDKVFGVYLISYDSMVNMAFFLFSPSWMNIFGVLLWLSPVSLKEHFKPILGIRYIYRRLRTYAIPLRKPFFISDLVRELPNLKNINDSPIAIIQQRELLSIGNWVWACACYLLDKNIIVYNGLPATEIPINSLHIPPNVREISLEELKKGR